MLHYGLAYHRDFAREHYGFFQGLAATMGDPRGLRILDVGCGKSYWLTLLLHSAGADAVGIDQEVARPSQGLAQGLAKYTAILRENGPERALRTLVWDSLFARPYYAELQRLCSFPLRFADVKLRAMSGDTLDFPDGSYDWVVSHEVFEHIADVHGALAEIARVLRPGGRIFINIHSFTSLSGGHHIAWKHPDTAPSHKVPPWDHLRQRRWPEIPSWLNGLRLADWRAAFARDFEVLEWRMGPREGEALLTPAIRTELAGYSEEELLTKGFTVLATPLRRT
jgi:SAM-dependent methyltransferase